MKLREPSREEETVLNRSFDRWGVYDFFQDKQVLVADGERRTVCLVSPMVKDLALSLDSFQTGLVIGDLKKNLSLTIAGASLFASKTTDMEYYVTVSDTAEQLVLYGRDVMGDSILSVADTLKENELVIILNLRREAIGVGRTRFPGHLMQQNSKITMTTIADAGLYLRDEG